MTMLLSGLWHGASWTFVIWGGLHAAGRVATRTLERSGAYRRHVPLWVKQLFVFAFVTFTWIFFRAASLEDASLIVARIFTSGWTDPQFPILLLAMIIGVWIYQFAWESRRQALLASAPIRVGLATTMALYLLLFASGRAQPFIYFQF
jgi:hypothetical protein